MEQRKTDRPPFTRILLAMIAALLVTAGCTSPKNAEWVHENLSHTEHFHSGTSVLETPPFPENKPHRATLRATGRSRGRRIGAEIELAVRAEFEDYSFLDRVSFAGASQKAFPLKVEKREPVDCGTTDRSLCNVYEFVSIRVSRDFLNAKKRTGFTAKLWGRRESALIHVPADYIEGLLARMEKRAPVVAPTGPVPAAKAP